MPLRFSAGGCKPQQGTILITGAFTDGSGSAIELHNRTAAAVSLTGWTIRVRTSLRAEQEALRGTLQPGQYMSVGAGNAIPVDVILNQLALDDHSSEIVLVPPSSIVQCAPTGDALSWGSASPLCPGPRYPGLLPFGYEGYRRSDPIGCANADSIDDFGQSTGPWAGLPTGDLRLPVTAG
jgi:hypothetical protein